MTDTNIPKSCPSCGTEGTLIVRQFEFVCGDKACGRAFPINSKLGLKARAKPKAKKKK